MALERKLQLKVVNAVGDLIAAVKNLRDVSIEVAAECDPDDQSAKGIIDMTSQIAQGILPLEVMHRQMQKKVSEG